MKIEELPTIQPEQPTITKKWYESLPADEQIDDESLAPLTAILENIANEYKNLDINYIVKRYEPVLSEFYELSAMYRANAKKYNDIFENFVQTLCKLYNIERKTMLVYSHKYSPSDWGNIYWEFLHLSSILLSYAYENGMITNLLDFSTLVYNIDVILPCPKCAYHYSTIKDSIDVKQVIKTMSFGSIMLSMQIFHNIITANIDKTPDYQNRPNRDPFLISDFALKYKCTDVQSETLRQTNTYMTSNIDWQPKFHVFLTIILSTYCDQPSYDRTSNLIKYRVYSNRPQFKNSPIKLHTFDVRAVDTSDLAFIELSDKQILYCISRALLLQFQDTELKPNQIQTNKRLNYAIVQIFKEFNDEIRKLIDSHLKSDENTEMRTTLLDKLDKVKLLHFE